jgi:hypothetical protein
LVRLEFESIKSFTFQGIPQQGVEKQESGRQARRAAMRQAQHIQE